MSDTSNKKLIHEGVEHISAETCFPIKIVHGHIINLVEKGVDYIFLPSIINQVQKNKTEGKSQNCPYVQTVPYIIRAALDLKIPLLTPILYMQRGFKAIRKDLVKFAKEHLNKNKKDIENAFDIAWEYQEKFYIALAKRGEEVLKQLPDNEKGIVIVSRPYNGCDPGLNLELPKKLRELGVLAIPMDFLPLDDIDVFKEWPNMFWRYGQKILNSAKIIRQRENLYALYITNFGCGPDSFITHFFRKVMNGKPYLQIEVDEHSAGAGAITRCEAYLDSLKNTKFTPPERIKKLQVVTRLKKEERTLYLQYMCEHAHLLQAAFQSTGINAEVLPPSDQETLEWGRKFTLGKECYPCIVSSGDILKKVNEPGFDPKKAAFFLPDGGGPCRFGQYSRLNRMILDELGFDDVPLFAPSADNSYDELGTDFHRKGWQAVVISDILLKLLRETRPYELNKGETNKVYKASVEKMRQSFLTNGHKKHFVEELKGIRNDFESIPQDRSVPKPIVGIVGEIYVRLNAFSNENLVDKIEALGGEVWVATMSEWILYTNVTAKWHYKWEGRWKDLMVKYIQNWVQRSDEHSLEAPFKGYLKNIHEKPIETILELSKPYIDPTFEGEACLTVGKSIDMAKSGLAGIINALPFTCMPGVLTSAISKRIREDYDNIPYINMAYDGLEQTTAITRLEAFMYQTQQYWNKKGKK